MSTSTGHQQPCVKAALLTALSLYTSANDVLIMMIVILCKTLTHICINIIMTSSVITSYTCSLSVASIIQIE